MENDKALFDLLYVLVGIAFVAAFGFEGYRRGKKKGRGMLGLLLGTCLAFVGILIVENLPSRPHPTPRGVR